MRAVRWRTVALVLVLTVAACSDDKGSGPTTTAAPTPSFVGDGSPFCNAMLSVGQVSSAQGATKKEVLDANEELITHLDEAQANTPADAPTDFDALIDDYRIASTAIFDADGDVTKAFEALQAEQPEVYARLGSSTSHKAAYDFLVERCGINPPPGG